MKNLANDLRPKQLSDIIGQEHLTAPDQIIGRMVRAKTLSSILLYGPPGTGKTSIAMVLANELNLPYYEFNASIDNKARLQQIIKESDGKTIVLLLDEIHRLTKPLQDFLLPFTEKSQIILVGATTENPYIDVNPALRSRLTILQVFPVKPEDIKKALKRAISHLKNELTPNQIVISDELLAFTASSTNGDVRSSINALDLVVKSTEPTAQNEIIITKEALESVLQRKVIDGDKNGDAHYNLLSAFQKAIRGSDVNASLHYLARLIQIGDLESICRRLSIIAYEDIGVANQAAVINANLAIQVAKQTGLPEARIPLANAVIELAASPKTNIAEMAIDAALNDLQARITTIPNHLRDTHFKDATALGHVGYKYPHDYPKHYVYQRYLPNSLIGHNYVVDEHPINENVERVLKMSQMKTKQDLDHQK